MIKRIFILFFVISVVVYLLLAVTVLNSSDPERVCTDIELTIKDSEHGDFISKNEVFAILKRHKMYPIDTKMEQISTKKIENQLQKHPLIDQVQCYKTPSNKIGIDIHQKIPVLRVSSNTLGSFLVDNKRGIMPSNTRCVADLPVVTGNVTKEHLQGELYDFINYIDEDDFWNNQISQVHVVKKNQIEIIPRVGEHIVILGDLSDYKDKLKRLKIFYDKVLNQVGWNKYKVINIEISNQVICTKANNN
jgi:cell division protein FtsQ